MGLEIVCPICNLEHIAHDRETCPQCDADLTCFKVLDRLAQAADSLTSPKDVSMGKKRAVLILFLAGLAVLVLASLGFGLYGVQMIESRLTQQQSAFKHAIETAASQSGFILEKQDQIVSLIREQLEIQRQLPAAQPSPEIRTDAQSSAATKNGDPSGTNPFANPSGNESATNTAIHSSEAAAPAFKFYHATDEDTLWDIAERFYGAGFLYPVLLEHNPNLSIYTVGHSDRIALLKEVAAVKRIYRAITLLEEDRLYWYYSVRSGDTPMLIKRRYCPEQACLPSTFDSRPNAQLDPGTKIKIQLAGALK